MAPGAPAQPGSPPGPAVPRAPDTWSRFGVVLAEDPEPASPVPAPGPGRVRCRRHWQDVQVISTSIMWFCVLYGMTVWTTRSRFILGAAFLGVSDLLTLLGKFAKTSSSVPFTVVTLVVMLLVRRVVGDRERRAQLAERERDVAAREAVVEERARIARELHDAIAHNVSMMVRAGRRGAARARRRARIDARGARDDRADRPQRAHRDAPARRDAAQRRATTRWRRSPGSTTCPRSSAQVREAGLPVELARRRASARELPVGIELSAYRIVQEALTNALKHAGDAHAAVRVRYGADSLELEIVDDGAGDAARAAERRPRPGRDARARRALRRPARRRAGARAAASPSASCCRCDDDAS